MKGLGTGADGRQLMKREEVDVPRALWRRQGKAQDSCSQFGEMTRKWKGRGLPNTTRTLSLTHPQEVCPAVSHSHTSLVLDVGNVVFT